MNKSLFKPAEVLKRSDQTKKEEVDVTVVDGTIQDDVDMQSEVEISHEVKSVESEGDVIVISEKFFKSKVDSIGRREKPAKKRRCLSSVVSGRAITETAVIQKINEHNEAVNTKKKPDKSSIKDKKVPSKLSKDKQKAKMQKVSEPVPGPSGIITKKHNVPTMEPSYSSSDEEIADDEKCCQCGKYQPAELINSNYVYFTKWGQCMHKDCLHWTHLKFCCNVYILRAKDTLYCPCHDSPGTPIEE